MTIEETWEKLGQKLKNHRLIKSNSATASCPAHKDGVPSLSIQLKKDIILLKCHAGCTFSEIIKALRLSSSDFKKKTKHKNIKKEICRYPYLDEKGKILGYVVRFSPKSFLRLRKINGDDIWNWNEIKHVPYRLPQLLEANNEKKEVFLVEGEKDADNLNRLGYYSTTFPGGAGKWRNSFKKFFIESDLILIPDNDDAGIKGMERIAEHLYPVTKRLRIIYLNNENNKSDISDWLEKNSFDKNLLDQLIRTKATDWEQPDKSKNNLQKTAIDELNNEYAVLTMGNKVVILWESNNEERFLPVQDFRIKLKNKWINQQKA